MVCGISNNCITRSRRPWITWKRFKQVVLLLTCAHNSIQCLAPTTCAQLCFNAQNYSKSLAHHTTLSGPKVALYIWRHRYELDLPSNTLARATYSLFANYLPHLEDIYVTSTLPLSVTKHTVTWILNTYLPTSNPGVLLKCTAHIRL